MAHIFGSIWDRFNRNALNDLSKNVETQGKFIQDLVAKGQLTPSQYVELLRVVNGLVKSGEIDVHDLSAGFKDELDSYRKLNDDISLDDLSPELLEAINNGDGTPFEILSIPRDGSVTPEKTTFIKRSSNLYNPNTALKNTGVLTTGELTENNARVTSDFIEVKGGETYTLSGFIRIVYYDDNSGIGSRESLDESWTSVAPEGAKYARVSYNPNVHLGFHQINESSTLLPYEPHYLKMDSEILGASVGYNISTKLDFEYGSINLTDGIINKVSVQNHETTRRIGKYLKVRPATTLMVNYDVGNLAVFEYDNQFNLIKSLIFNDRNDIELSPETHHLKFMISDVSLKDNPVCNITFNSPTSEIQWTKNGAGINTVRNVNFIFESNINSGTDIYNPTGSDSQVDTDIHFGAGLLRLPPNYSHDGDATRLIIFTAGAGSYNNFESGTFGPTYEDYYEYLADEGYAILSVYTWTTKDDIRANENFGSPSAIANLRSAYSWVIDNYNIKKDGVFIAGKSAGGYTGVTLAHNKGVPVLAVGMLAPAINPTARPFGYGLEARIPYTQDFGFEGDVTILDAARPTRNEAVKNYIRSNFPKMSGYNSLTDGIVNVSVTTLAEWSADNTIEDAGKFDDVVKVINFPIKFWVADDDVNIDPTVIKNYVTAVKNGNGIAELRMLPNGTGAHNAVDSHENALRINIKTRLNIPHTGVPLAYAELVQFFRRFE